MCAADRRFEDRSAMRMLAAVLSCSLSLAFAATADAKTFRIKAGPGAATAAEAAALQARDGDRIRFDKGVFPFTKGLELTQPGVRLEGAGADKTVLSFLEQSDGQPAIRLGGGAQRLRGLAIEDAMNGAVYAADANGLAFQNLAVRYTMPARVVTADGLDLARVRDVLIENVVITGAVDAGIHLSQANNVVIRNTVADENGVGLVLADTSQADVYDNSFSGNGLGLAVIDFAQVAGETASIRAFRNQILRNDRKTRPSSLLGIGAPSAVGAVVMAAHDVHLFQNKIGEHGGANLLILSTSGSPVDPNYIPVTHNLMIRDNVFGRSGFAPQGQLMTLRDRGFVIPDILWDGVESYGEAEARRTLPVRISIVNNLKENNEALRFVSLGIGNAGGALETAKPNETLPPPSVLSEPAPVALPRL